MRLMLLSIALASAACVSPSLSAPAESVQTADGRFLANVHCSECHAVGRTDRSKHPAAPPLRFLSRNYPVVALEKSLADGIGVGHPDMPEFRFRPEDVAAVISYLESIQE